MFPFGPLNRIVRDMTNKVSTALQIAAPADKVEALLAARDESNERMRKLEIRTGDFGFGGLLGFFPGLGMMIAGATPFLAAPSLAAVTGVLLAAPLFTAGLGLAAVSLGTLYLGGKVVDRLRDDRDIIEKRIHREVLNIVQMQPKEAEKSQRYLHSLVRVYNAAAENDTSYEKMAARVQRKPPAPAAA